MMFLVSQIWQVQLDQRMEMGLDFELQVEIHKVGLLMYQRVLIVLVLQILQVQLNQRMEVGLDFELQVEIQEVGLLRCQRVLVVPVSLMFFLFPILSKFLLISRSLKFRKFCQIFRVFPSSLEFPRFSRIQMFSVCLILPAERLFGVAIKTNCLHVQINYSICFINTFSFITVWITRAWRLWPVDN